MRRSFYCTASAIALFSASAASAGETPLYAPAPSWVDEAVLSEKVLAGSDALLLAEKQARLEKGLVSVYNDVAIKMDSPEALTGLGTLSATWLPDKGDLIVHRVELLRAGTVINVLKDGGRFEVLRREAGLESRMISGELTATMSLPGARVGDVLRMAYTTTQSDQALGDEVQWIDIMPAKPFPLASGRIILSWPDDLAIEWKAGRGVAIDPPKSTGGFTRLVVPLPLAELPEMPSDAPVRFRMPPLLQASSFATWSEISSVMAPYYATEGTIAEAGPIAAEVARITRQTDVPLERAAAAVQLVQDQVSYLLNGLDGGNYLPQSPEETWEQRFGDCKAKSYLLLAMLRAMGIEADAVLVSSRSGDMVPGMLPMPASFDHVIVQAKIGGVNYWLDGTSAGTRLGNIDAVPRFFHALPIVAEGAELVPLEQRPQTMPDEAAEITIDQRAGLGLPALYTFKVAISGVGGAGWRSISAQENKEVLESAVRGTISGYLGQTQVIDQSVTYDEAAGLAIVTANGLVTSPWTLVSGQYELQPPAQSAQRINFDNDRTRAAWRDLPIALNGPVFVQTKLTMLLPDAGAGYETEGVLQMAENIGNVAVKSQAGLDGERFTLVQEMKSIENELPAAELGQAKRDLARVMRNLPELKAPRGSLREWDYTGALRKRMKPIDDAYARLVADAEPDETLALENRIGYRIGVQDFAGALADLDTAIGIEASEQLISQRAFVKSQLGDLNGALADYEEVETLNPSGTTYSSQIELLGLLGRAEDGVTLAEDFAEIAETAEEAKMLEADALGWAGQASSAIEILNVQLLRRPGDASLLNALCWQSGVWNLVDEKLIQTCTNAVEKSNYSPPILDSRGMAYYRLGQLDNALADMDAALADGAALPETRYMRGIVKIAKGDKAGGQADIAQALRMRPSLAAVYAAWGIKP